MQATGHTSTQAVPTVPMQGSAMMFAISQLPRVGSPGSESMLITSTQVEAHLLALFAFSILCKRFWLDTDIHPGNLPRHIPLSPRGAGIHACECWACP